MEEQIASFNTLDTKFIIIVLWWEDTILGPCTEGTVSDRFIYKIMSQRISNIINNYTTVYYKATTLIHIAPSHAVSITSIKFNYPASSLLASLVTYPELIHAFVFV